MKRTRAAVIAVLMLLPLGGCIDAYRDFEDFDSDGQYRNVGVFEGSYRAGNAGSLPLETGILRPAMRPDIVVLESERPAYGAAAPIGQATGAVNTVTGHGEGDESRAYITMAIWHPDNYTEKRPVIVDAGPYYDIGDATIEDPGQSTPMLLQNMLPRGYSIVQLAVRGTGKSGGCMDLFGPDETADIDQALTWLGEQEWSNGNIGMIGVSYDGSTPWTAAGTGNPYLKTIVPISGLPDIYDLMLRNGSAETRAALMHGADVYWGYGFGEGFPQAPAAWTEVEASTGLAWPVPPAGIGQSTNRDEYQDRQNLVCPEAVEGQAAGRVAASEGSRLAEASDYWTERDHRQRVLDNYQGSIFLIHGLQDWNVDPHAAIPFNVRLREAGFEMKEWYGQWGHQRPDSNCAPGAPSWTVLPCRLDYGEVLARWFDKYLLEDASIDTGPAVQVQDNIGIWRNVEAFPPVDLTWSEMALGADGVLGDGAAQGEVTLPAANEMNDIRTIRMTSALLEEDLHISGMPEVRVPFSVQGQGGQLAAWLFDVDPQGRVRSPSLTLQPIAEDSDVETWKPAGLPIVGHGQMNLRFYAGGDERQVLVPDERYVARMQLEPMDAHIPAGHRLMLWVFQYQYPDHASSPTSSDVVVHLDDEAVLRLPTVTIDPRTTFPVPGVTFPESAYIEPMYVEEPFIPGVDSRPESGMAGDGDPVVQVAKASGATRVAGKLPTACGGTCP